jgi:hypothetical protein
VLRAVSVLLDNEEFHQWGQRPHPGLGPTHVQPTLQPLPRLHDIPCLSAFPSPVLQRDKVHDRHPIDPDISFLRRQHVFPACKRYHQPSADPQERVLKRTLCAGKRRSSVSLFPAGLFPPPQLLMVIIYSDPSYRVNIVMLIRIEDV